MNEFIKTLLSLSLSGTLLFLLVFLLKRLYRERFSKRWQYYIWLVVALRFLLPFAPGVTFSGYLFDRVGVIAATEAGENNSVPANADHMPGFGSDAYRTAQNQNDSKTDMQGRDIDADDNKASGIFFLWLIPAIALLVRKATAYHSFLGFLKAASTPVSDVETLNILSDCQEQLHIRGTVELYTNPMIASPILAGFFRPRILLPGYMPPVQQTLSYIFTHELIHYKRRDMYYKWFIQLILCVHWFNPFAYLLAKEISRACELACDESVTIGLDDTGKKAYGDTLLAFLRTDDTYRSPLASITLAEGAKELKERLGAIMRSHKKTKAMTLLTVLATAAVCAAFCTLGAYAKSGRDSFLNDAFYEYDNGIYYIYTDGADHSHKPIVGFTDGTIGIVLIHKEGYTSLGPFDPDDFPEQIVQTCKDMTVSRHLSSEDADVILMLAGEIEDDLRRAPRPAGNTVSGHTFAPSPEIVCEDVELRYYENGGPYLHDTLVNHTEQTIAQLEYCLLAYDAEGHPLKLHWNFMDSSAKACHDNLIRRTGLQLRPGQATDNYLGGWSLEQEEADSISYILFCLKEVVFEDGAVWNNPAYGDWQEAYAEKEVHMDELRYYYPQEYAIID